MCIIHRNAFKNHDTVFFLSKKMSSICFFVCVCLFVCPEAIRLEFFSINTRTNLYRLARKERKIIIIKLVNLCLSKMAAT